MQFEDHPRLRGEKQYEHRIAKCSKGSSPLARGKVAEIAALCHNERIIPACAGKSIIRTTLEMYPKDHPRLRGEKRGFLPRKCRQRGSSPLARGKASRSASSAKSRRIIPACAGKSKKPCCCVSAGRDHPRLRGEKLQGSH